MTNKKVAIKGDMTIETGDRILEYLKGIGGINSQYLNGISNDLYFINSSMDICYCSGGIIPEGYELVTLPEPNSKNKTFPREMWVWDDNELRPHKKTVIGLFKDRYVVDVDFEDNWAVYKHAKEIETPKPLTTDEKIANLQKQIDELKSKNQ